MINDIQFKEINDKLSTINKHIMTIAEKLIETNKIAIEFNKKSEAYYVDIMMKISEMDAKFERLKVSNVEDAFGAKPKTFVKKKEIPYTDPKICPLCGGATAEKKSQRGKFIGCSNYSVTDCRYSRDL